MGLSSTGARRVAAAAAMLAMAAQHGAAQSAAPAAAPPQDGAAAAAPAKGDARWTPECGALVCVASIAIHAGPADALTGSVRFEWARYGAKAGLISATVSAPLGIAVEPGLRLMIDGRAIEMPVKVCFPDGCAAAAALDAEQSQALRAVHALEIRFIAFADGRTVSLTPDLTGLTDALAGG